MHILCTILQDEVCTILQEEGCGRVEEIKQKLEWHYTRGPHDA